MGNFFKRSCYSNPASSGINDLPAELFLEIFKYLSLNESLKCIKICTYWRKLIAIHIVGPQLLLLRETGQHFKDYLEKNGWTENCNDADLLLEMYDVTNSITSK